MDKPNKKIMRTYLIKQYSVSSKARKPWEVNIVVRRTNQLQTIVSSIIKRECIRVDK